MTHELVAEANRLSRDLTRIMTQAPAIEEVPLDIHCRDIDGGGAPEFHHEFVRYVGPICNCGRAAICAPNCHFMKDKVLGHLDICEPACRDDTRFHASKHRNTPTRMKRALRQVRRLNPKAYDFLYLVVALHYTFEQAAAKINADNVIRGQRELSPAEFAVLWVSGASMLTVGF